MENRTYAEAAAEVACLSQIAVMVLLGPENDDVEFWPLRPRQSVPTSSEEFAARRLRPVGVLGLRGLEFRSALKEPLPADVLRSVGFAFGEYVHSLVGTSMEMQLEAGEIAELERVLALPDTRPV